MLWWLNIYMDKLSKTIWYWGCFRKCWWEELGIPIRIWISTLSWLASTVKLSYNLCQSLGKMFVIWWKSIDAFELWCWRLLRVPWTTRRLNQSIQKEINPEYSLEGLVLKLQHFGHLMQRVDTLEDPDAGKDWSRGERDARRWDGWMTSRLNRHKFVQDTGDGEGHGSLASYSPWGCRVRHGWVTEQQPIDPGKKLQVTVVVKLESWSVRHDIVCLVQRAGKAGSD